MIKSSKKGFTLVELVVVIAILAILAAIAIPAVIGIINSANESQTASDAATVDNACKTYFSGIVSGTINASNFTPTKQSPADTLPAATASSSVRKTNALAATIGGALEYNGTYETLSGKLGDFGVTNDGNIYARTDAAHSTQIDTSVTLSTTTTMQALHYK